ncbi:MAG: ceramidase domain-containing protein [Methylococcales bacterium]
MPSLLSPRQLKLTLGFLGILLASSLIAVFGFLAAIPEDPAYHDFAPGTLESTHIPNSLNVLTNIPFAIVGLYGLVLCIRLRQPFARWSWSFFFIGVGLTSIGSAAYHWNPTDASLVWDRVPMTIAFASLFAAMLSELIDPNLEKFLLAPLILAGISSVVYGYYAEDLRCYGLIQFFPIVALSLLMLIIRERYTAGHLLCYALLFYMAAKIFEFYDHETWRLIGVGGHPLKHLLASCSTICLLLRLKRRQAMLAFGRSVFGNS